MAAAHKAQQPVDPTPPEQEREAIRVRVLTHTRMHRQYLHNICAHTLLHAFNQLIPASDYSQSAFPVFGRAHQDLIHINELYEKVEETIDYIDPTRVVSLRSLHGSAYDT